MKNDGNIHMPMLGDEPVICMKRRRWWLSLQEGEAVVVGQCSPQEEMAQPGRKTAQDAMHHATASFTCSMAYNIHHGLLYSSAGVRTERYREVELMAEVYEMHPFQSIASTKILLSELTGDYCVHNSTSWCGDPKKMEP